MHPSTFFYLNNRVKKPYYKIKKESKDKISFDPFGSPGDVLLSQGESPQLPSALRSLTSVFGMGTGVTFSLSPPDYVILRVIPSKLDNAEEELQSNQMWLSPRSISICQLHVSPRFHLRPINLIIFQGSY